MSLAEALVNFFAPGEKIIAMQYRTLKFKWFSSNKVDSAYLGEHNRWKVYLEDDKGEPTVGVEDVEDEVDVEEDDEMLLGDLQGEHEIFADNTEVNVQWLVV